MVLGQLLSMTRRSPSYALRAAGAVLLCITALAASPRPSNGQQLRVRVHHYAKGHNENAPVDDDAWYWAPGRPDSVAGLPPSPLLMEIPPGAQVCYEIVGANPLLYTYGVSTTEVPITPSADLAELVKSLSTLVQSQVEKAGALLAGDPVGEFRQKANDLARQLAAVTANKQASDGNETFAITFSTDSIAYVTATSLHERLTALWPKLTDPQQEELADAKTLAELAWSSIDASHNAVVKTASVMRADRKTLRVCKPMPSARTQYGLTIAARQDAAPVKPARLVTKEKEQFASFTVEPQYTERFKVAAGVFSSGLFSKDRDVGIKDGKVSIDETGRTYTRTGMFVMGRATDHIWPTIGVAKGDKSSVDVFTGIAVRAGNLLIGPEVSVGLGLTWMEVPIGAGSLKTGDPVPNGKTVDDIVSRQRQFGLGLTFTITGLKLGADKSDDKGTKAASSSK